MAAVRTGVTKFKWKLEDFKKRFLDGNKSASSGLFSLNGGSTTKFYIQISDSCIYLMCQNFGQDEEKIKLIATFWIEHEGKKFGEIAQSCSFEKTGNITKSDNLLPGAYYTELKTEMQDGNATICFRIQQELPVNEASSKVSHEAIQEVSTAELEDNIYESFGKLVLSLHEDGTLITIKAEEKEVKIFKRLLIHHSEVFKKMLTTPSSTEAKSGTIKIEDLKAEVIEAMRDWMYAIKIENLDEIAPSLFQVAHKYKIVKLKEKCIHSMSRGLTWENLLSRLMIAYKYSEDLLKQCTLDFIRNDIGNLRQLMTSDGWLKLCNDDLELVKKIVASI